jgi:hypothetical protein
MKAYLAAIGVGVFVGAMCVGLGVVIGRLSARPVAAVTPAVEDAAKPVVAAAKTETRKQEAPREKALSDAEKKLIRAIAESPRKGGERVYPPVDPQNVGSVGFIIRSVKVTQVVDELSFLGTMQWRIVSRDPVHGTTYQANDDARYTAWFLGVNTRDLFDDKILSPFPPKSRVLIFEDGWETVTPLRYTTTVGSSRTVMSLLRFDASRVRKLTDGKSDEALAELLKSLGD